MTMLRRGCWAAALLLAWSGNAAADVNFNGGAIGNCSLAAATKTYTCLSIQLPVWNDKVIIADGYTVITNTGFAPTFNNGLIMGRTSVLRSAGLTSIDLSNVNPASVDIGGGTLIAGGNLALNSSMTINGSVSAGSLNTGSAVTITGSVNASGVATLGSNIRVNGNVTAGAVTTNSPGRIDGSITSTTTVYIDSGITVGGDISGTIVTTNSGVTLNGSVNASLSFLLGSGSTVNGDLSSPSIVLAPANSKVTGDINTTGILNMGSGTTVTGTVNAGGLLMNAAGANINGNVTVSGDVLMQAGSSINGDLSARNVVTQNSNANIYGNAAVNTIYLDYDNVVTGFITCTGLLGSQCNCVLRPLFYNHPLQCTSGTSAVHHFQIKHSGFGLTCQPQTVELKACANAACTATVSTTTKVTLSPGGGDVNVTGTTNAQVRYSTATGNAGVTLSATAAGVNNANVCQNTGANNASCQMVFKDEGLVLSAPDHVAMTPNVKLSVQALKNSPLGSCVPLVQGATVPVKFSCGYLNPLPANANAVGVSVAGTNLSCGGGTTDVNLTFDSNGVATPSPSLQYSEVGVTSLSAAYATNGLSASGTTQFTTAPAKIKLEPIRINTPANFFSATAFAKASEPFKVRLTALNYNDVPTKNFGRESPTPQNFMLPTPVLINPINGNAPLTIGSYKGIANGVADATDGTPGQWRFDDTGTLRVTVKLDGSNGYYLGNPTTGFNPQQSVDLTFVPDHFDVALLAGTPMDCASTGLSNPCAGSNANGKFVYSKQPIPLLINAYVGLKDASGAYLSPQNYVGAAARPIALSAWSTATPSAAVPSSVGDFNWTKTPPATPPFTFAYDPASKKTVGTLAGAATNLLPSYDFATAPTAPTTITVRATDSDGASSAGFAEPPITVVSGRLDIESVSGPLTGTVPVTAKAQYWNGRAYVFNPRFAPEDPSQPAAQSQALTVSLSRTDAGVKTYYLQYRNCKNGLYSGNAAQPCNASAMPKLATESITFRNGKGIFRLTQPTPALTRNGLVEVALHNTAFDNDPDKDKAELIKYLPSGFGTVIFGVYRSGPLIYLREVYN
ncbi:hypothetical protein GTP44_12500 [Duganella sp. FT50W]|uniref:DUF6701 domain-containing protein n=2 Tax=Duganella lactea TaxID=2692173 RepID=A0A6L8MJM6_9BURK|nr:hypothetical protein [Duganella lactea]